MSVYILSEKEVLSACKETLGLPTSSGQLLDDVFLSAMLRHIASVQCPCSRTFLKNVCLNNLEYLVSITEELGDRIESLIEGLIVSGDLLELDQVTTDDLDAKGTWVFLAPPSFVTHSNGEIFLTGITPDEVTPLPEEFISRVEYVGNIRTIKPLVTEDVSALLRQFGFLELSSNSWLKPPKIEAAHEFKNRIELQLKQLSRSGDIEELSILDAGKSVSFYKGRWCAPKKETGIYIARRPQAYGAALWGLVELVDGSPIKFLDFPLKGMPFRGCDIAWRLQMAIDFCNGSPQYYRKRLQTDGAYLDFFSPLPLWAERRLMIFGRSSERQNSLLSYWLPLNVLETEESFLKTHLWLKCNETG